MDVERIRLLQQMPIFGGVSEETLRSLCHQAQIVSVARGGLFFGEGAEADAVYVLEQGQAVVLKSWQGRLFRLNSLKVGDCFGEMAIIDMSPRSAAVEAVDDCRAMKLSTANLYDVYEHHPDQYFLILMNMAREISRRLRLADERLFMARIAEDEIDPGGAHYLV